MFLARLSVQRPVLTTMFILLFIVIGVRSYTMLAQDLTPNIDFPFVMVQTIYPGAGPKEIESSVTKLIEDEVGSISNLRQMQSYSREALSFIFLEFELGSDADLKAIEVKDKIEAVRANLPEDAKPPAVFKFDFGDEPVINLAISSPRSLEETYRIADQQIKDFLATVDGVSSVDIIGGRQREIRVALQRQALRSYGLSVMDVMGMLAAENLNYPVGRIIGDANEISLRIAGKFDSLEDIRRVRIPTGENSSVYLSDVAEVLDTYIEPRDQSRFETEETVSLQIRKKRDANTVAVSDGVSKAIVKLAGILPADIQITTVQDRAEYIRDSIKDARNSILIGIILTSLFLFLFLHDIRATSIAAVSMPAAIVASFTPMLFSEFTLNIISLMALGVSVGVLVANSIVVLESISSYIEKGYSPEKAAIEGTNNVAVAVIASTATNLVVFTPIAFMAGIIGQFFKQFGLTVVFATVFSLIMSFTLVPMLASLLYRAGGKKHEMSWVKKFSNWWNTGYNGLARWYRNTLSWSLVHRWVVIVLTFLAFFGGIMLFRFIGMDFFPESDENIMRVSLKLPAGTSLKKTDEVMQEIDSLVRTNYDKYIISSLQSIGGEGKGPEEGSITFKLVDKLERDLSAKQLVARTRPLLATIPAADISISTSEGHGPGEGLQMEITGPDLNVILDLNDKLMQLARELPELVDVRSTYVAGKPELTFTPDREQMINYGATTGQVALTLRTAFEGDVPTRYREIDEEYDIRVQLSEDERTESSDFTDIFLRMGPQYVPLTQLGAIDYTVAETEIRRKDKQRMVEVSGNIAQGSLGEAQQAMQKLIDEKIDLPAGYNIHFGGQSEFMAETFSEIMKALLLAIILTYMVLAATLESLVHPFTIMLTLPLGLIGVSLSLFLSGISLNMMSMMAIVMLVGIVVNNAILILDYASQLRSAGWRICDALIEAATVRLRPVIMMNLAIAISLLPQTLAGAGAEFRAAIAMVTIGGVLVSSVFTLYLIPTMYTYFDRLARPPRLQAGAVADSLPAADGPCEIK